MDPPVRQPTATGATSTCRFLGLSPAACAAALGTDPERGLAPTEAARRRVECGPNALSEAPRTPRWRRLLEQFRETVVLLLLAAAVLSGLLGDLADTLAIGAIVLLNGILGFLQEEKAERALRALGAMTAPLARAVRGGAASSVAASDLVPGDLILVEAGDRIPADARLVYSAGLRVQEAALTGESEPVGKDAAAAVPSDAPLAERPTLLHQGTVVVAGKGRALVVATGMDTELGKIAGMLQATPREPTPLQQDLARLGRTLVCACLVAVAIIFAVEVARGRPFHEVLLTSISLAVAAVPEGLPAVVTLALALGLERMVRRNALVRKLSSVETLGAVTVICSDKTGTLTCNEMTAREIATALSTYVIAGAGYEPRGEFQCDGRNVDVLRPEHTDLVRALEIGAWCSDAELRQESAAGARWQIVGDPTEGALVVAAAKAGIARAGAADLRIVGEMPFDSDRKRMSVIVRRAGGGDVLWLKGAPEVVLPRCDFERAGGAVRPLAPARREAFARQARAMAARALRVLALAERDPAGPPDGAGGWPEERLTLVALVGLIDPPRKETAAAVERCRTAGIRPVMITGDHPETAGAIAREIGIIAAGDDRVVTGAELDAGGIGAAAGAAVFARVTAAHKRAIVYALKERGQVVAMTGDGVNDAPALRAADVGIAMGLTGTDVTREASDIVLTDDNFASIVSAVEEGRGIFDDIRKFVRYLLSCNVGEVAFMLAAAALGWPAPLLPIQILWLNLVTDGLPALALGMEPPERGIMQRPPRRPGAPILSRADGVRILASGALVALAALAAFAWILRGSEGGGGADDALPRARTAAFTTMAFAQLLLAPAFRSQRATLPELGPFGNPKLIAAIAISGLLHLAVVALPFAQGVFATTLRFSAGEVALVLLLALLPVTAVECEKLGRALLRRRRDAAVRARSP